VSWLMVGFNGGDGDDVDGYDDSSETAAAEIVLLPLYRGVLFDLGMSCFDTINGGWNGRLMGSSGEDGGL
ncbi:hypothetical protein L195_g058495, partial [Trifolium pratense]